MGTPRDKEKIGGGGVRIDSCCERGTHLRVLFADGGMEYCATEQAPAAGGGSSFRAAAGWESSR
jgi:hypothetical protein